MDSQLAIVGEEITKFQNVLFLIKNGELRGALESSYPDDSIDS